jgi:hypothetical protein
MIEGSNILNLTSLVNTSRELRYIVIAKAAQFHARLK